MAWSNWLGGGLNVKKRVIPFYNSLDPIPYGLTEGYGDILVAKKAFILGGYALHNGTCANPLSIWLEAKNRKGNRYVSMVNVPAHSSYVPINNYPVGTTQLINEDNPAQYLNAGDSVIIIWQDQSASNPYVINGFERNVVEAVDATSITLASGIARAIDFGVDLVTFNHLLDEIRIPPFMFEDSEGFLRFRGLCQGESDVMYPTVYLEYIEL